MHSKREPTHRRSLGVNKYALAKEKGLLDVAYALPSAYDTCIWYAYALGIWHMRMSYGYAMSEILLLDNQNLSDITILAADRIPSLTMLREGVRIQ